MIPSASARQGEFWVSDRALRWIQQQSLDDLLATREELRQLAADHNHSRSESDGSKPPSRIGYEVITEELTGRRRERINKDNRHAPLGEDPQHTRDLDAYTDIAEGDVEAVSVDLGEKR